MGSEKADLMRDLAVLAPNILTAGRILATPLLLLELAAGESGIALYVVACVSDVLDGALARSLSSETSLGSTLDAFADFLLVLGVSAYLLAAGLLQPWFLALVVFAFAQFVVSRPRPGADPLGKHIGTVLFIALGVSLTQPNPWVVGWSSLVASGYIAASVAVRWLKPRLV